MIPCTLRRHLRKHHKNDINVGARYGTYVQSLFHSIKGYGKKLWAVGVEIDLDYESFQDEYGDEEIIRKCIEYLNTPPRSKYGKRRKRKLPYGAFETDPYRFWVKEKDGKRHIQALLLVDKRRNRKFWGEGPQL